MECAVRFSQHSVVSVLVDTVDDNFQSDFTIATRVACGLLDVVVIGRLLDRAYLRSRVAAVEIELQHHVSTFRELEIVCEYLISIPGVFLIVGTRMSER
jgi:hypothetical protein